MPIRFRTVATAIFCGAALVSAHAIQERRLDRATDGDERRVALVIGNDTYADAPLKNARNDARTVKSTLESVGFRVTLLEDATRQSLTAAVADFGDRLQADDVALLYFAGHGVQVEGENYVVPIDFRGRSASDVRLNAVKVSEVAQLLQAARVSMLILDACRNNPYAATRGGAGLASMEARGNLIAFATGAGQTASDAGDGNGLFTQELVKAIAEPGLTVQQVFQRVRRSVYALSGGRQFPAVYDGLLGDFVFRGGVPTAFTPPAVPDPRPISTPEAAPTAASTSGATTITPTVAAGGHLVSSLPTSPGVATDWPIRNLPSGSGFSPLDQINSRTTSAMSIKWRLPVLPADLSKVFPGATGSARYGHSPSVVGGVLYASTGIGTTAAFDAESARLLWYHVPDSPLSEGEFGPTGGLAYWTDGREARVFAVEGRSLVALNARTGARYADFGVNGRVDLASGYSGRIRPLLAESAPTIVGDAVVIGGVSGLPAAENRHAGASLPSDALRAFDARTGRLLWAFSPIPRDGEFGAETWKRGRTDAAGRIGWSRVTADESLGLLYVTFGSPTIEASARPGDNLYADSVVAIDARTGRRVWHFQIVHHPPADTALPSAPVLADVSIDGRPKKIVVQGSRSGFVYAFDRATGMPIWPIEERSVSGTEPGGSSTQPVPTKIDVRAALGEPGAPTGDAVLGGKDFRVSAAVDSTGGMLYLTRTHPTRPQAFLIAVDLKKGLLVWSVSDAFAAAPPLVTSTLVFATGGGALKAYDKRTGRQLGAVQLNGEPSGGPITFVTNGTQYLVVATSRPGEPTEFVKIGAR